MSDGKVVNQNYGPAQAGSTDVYNMTSVRSALAFAMECLERSPIKHDDLERAVGDALHIANREELQATVISDLRRVRSRLGFDS